jgi:DNA polymerase
VDASVVLVSGEPFARRTADALKQMVEEAGFLSEDVYITPIVKCCLGTKPTLSQVQSCLPWLRKQYSILKPSVMVLLGRRAAQTILGQDIQISRCCGQWFQRGNTMMMPLDHPGSVVRYPLRRAICVEYLRKVKEVCKPVSRAPETVAV